VVELVVPTIADAGRIAEVINARALRLGRPTGVAVNAPRRGEDETVGWVEVLAVRRPWRRRGLGKALLWESFAALAGEGKRAVGLGVDAENTTGAVALYERVGMRVVRRTDRWERLAAVAGL
jgi:ribosomal protein S18 acetylase RimI-like enzyme